MATSSKQYKAIGEDLWKGRTEKIVRYLFSSAVLILTLKERGAVRDDVRRARRAAHTGLRGLRRS
jgi:UTP:GlnB (protein PII) uridylyltransferase